MENNENLLDIEKLMNELDERQKKLSERENKLFGLLNEQNQRLEKLWKGYKKLGWVNETQQESIMLIKDDFNRELKVLNERFITINEYQKEPNKQHDELEKWIANLLDLLQSRWDTMCLYKELWRKQRVEYRNKLISDIEKNSHLLLESDMSKAHWLEQVESFLLECKKVMDKENKLISAEEEQQDEFEFIYKAREQSFVIAQQLFLL